MSAPVAPPVRSLLTAEEVKQRARRKWFLLIWIVLFIYFDYVIHRDFGTLVLAIASLALALYPQEILARLGWTQRYQEVRARIPPALMPLVPAVPALAYTLIRGQGTSNGGSVWALLTAIVLGWALRQYGAKVDERLAPTYRYRDRVPTWARMALAPGGAIIFSFLIIHGNLADLPVLVGAKPSTAKSPVDLTFPFMAAAALSTCWSWWLLHQVTRPRTEVTG